MGYLGFKFDVSKINEVEFNSKKYLKNNLIIFVKSNFVKNDKIQIIGEATYLKNKECDFVLLNNNLEFVPFLFIDKPSIIYSKICVNDITIIDFEFSTFWFNAKKFKEIYSEFLIEEDDKIDENYFKIKINNIFNLIVNKNNQSK